MIKIRNINHLLNKYSSSYVPGEKRSLEYDNMIRQKNTLQDNIHLLHILNKELPETLQLNRCDMKIAENLVAVFNTNLKTLHKQAKTETILIVFIFYLKKMENPKLQIEDYTILKKYGLTTSIYSLIISRAFMYYMEHVPISIKTTTDYDHEKLIRNGGI